MNNQKIEINESKVDQQVQTLYVVAGGSGGHILPALELARRWKAQQEQDFNRRGRILFFGSSSYLDQKITAQYPFIDEHISFSLGKFALSKPWQFPRLVFQMVRAFFVSIARLIKQRPVKIITTGGLPALPVMIAGKLCRVPLELYELNVVPGKAIKFLDLFSQKTVLVFKKSDQFFKQSKKDKQKYQHQEYPLRFTPADRVYDKTVLLEVMNGLLSTKHGKQRLFDSSRKTLFILGGSQGSLLLNNLVKNFILTFPQMKSSLQIIHQTGYQDTTDWKSFYAGHDIPAFTFSYHHQIKELYLFADVVLSRAGAGTLFELLFFQKRSIIIPLIAKTTVHQVDNAQAMAEERPDLFTVLEQDKVQQSSSMLYQTMLKQLEMLKE